MNLSGIDMNLLVSLHWLLEERSVTRAAAKMGVSQPAMSHMLARLRAQLSDPLFVRAGRGISPTPRAESLARPLAALLRSAEQLLRPPIFDPATTKAELRLATSDYCVALLLPRVVDRLRREAPGLRLSVLPWTASSRADLDRGTLDVGVHPLATGPSGLIRRRLFDERFACLVCARSSAAREGLDLEGYVARPHVLAGVTGIGKGHVNEQLERMGLQRTVVLRISQILAAPLSIAGTDLVLTIPRRLATRLASFAGLAVLEPPPELSLPTFGFDQVWHERNHEDPAHQWFRGVVAEGGEAIDRPPGA